MADYRVNVNGFVVDAHYSEAEEKRILKPVLDEILRIQKRRKEGIRTIIFLVAPPGAGKSTLSAVLSEKARALGGNVQVLGLDGFHLPNDRLEKETMLRKGKTVRKAQMKGAPETFDVHGFLKALRSVRFEENAAWPVYDRTLHAPRDEWEKVCSDVLMIEGNWLLMDEPVWRSAEAFCDRSIAVLAEKDVLKGRLVERKMRGGKSRNASLAWYRRVDGPNIDRFYRGCKPTDIRLLLSEKGLSMI